MNPVRAGLLLACMALAAACSTSAPYKPEEFPIEDSPIGKFDVTGDVIVQSIQTDASTHALHGFNPPMLGDYATISQSLADQLKKAIDKDGVRLKTGVAKTIRVAVTDLNTSIRAFTYLSWLDVAVGLGDAPPAIIEVRTETGIFATGGYHACDHAISYAVLEILRNEDVRKYLAQEGAKPPKLRVPAFEGKAPAAAPEAPAQSGGGGAGQDATARLKELKNMLDQGLITQQQYEKKRQEILDSM